MRYKTCRSAIAAKGDEVLFERITSRPELNSHQRGNCSVRRSLHTGPRSEVRQRLAAESLLGSNAAHWILQTGEMNERLGDCEVVDDDLLANWP